MRIDFESSWISKLRYEPIMNGSFRGAWAIQAQINPDPVGGSAEHVVSIIFDGILKSPAAKSRRKLFRLSIETRLSEQDALHVQSLCTSLAEFGFSIQIVYNGLDYYPALQTASWVVAKSSSATMPHGGNEVWYLPATEKPIADPIVPVQPSTLMYLSPGKRDEAEILDFLGRSQFVWNMLL